MIRVLKLIENEARRQEEDRRVEEERRQRIEANEARLVAALLPFLPPAEEGATYTAHFGSFLLRDVLRPGFDVQMTYQKGQWVLPRPDSPVWWDDMLEYLLADVPE